MKQTRFFVGGAGDERPGTWTLPVCLKTVGGAHCELLSPETKVLAAAGAGPVLYANAVDKGYYRTAYTPGQLKAVTEIAESGLTVPERMGFLGDRWALTLAGQGPVGAYLDLAFALKNDANPNVLDAALGSIQLIRNKIATDEDRLKLNAAVRAEFGPVWARYAKPGKQEGGYERQQIRSELFNALGLAEDPAVIGEAHAITLELLSGKKVDDEDLVDVAVALSATVGNQEFYDRMLVVSEKAEDPGLQSEALETLAAFREPPLVIRTLDYAVSGQVRNQDSWVLLAIELSRTATRELAWSWIKEHWPQVKAQLTTASGSNLITAAGTFCSVEKRDEVQSFFAAHPVDASERSLKKAVDSINDCVRLRATQEPNLKSWLSNRVP